MKQNKTTMRAFLIFVFSLIIKTGWCQQHSLTRQEVKNLLKSDLNNIWTSCNQDSAFFKADTIKFYNNINYFYQKSNCCNLIQWRFYKKDAFTLSNLEVCKEPPTGSVLTENDYFKIRLHFDKSMLRLSIQNRKGSSDPFQIIDLQEIKLSGNEKSEVLVLRRVIVR